MQTLTDSELVTATGGARALQTAPGIPQLPFPQPVPSPFPGPQPPPLPFPQPMPNPNPYPIATNKL